jgi:hypothetical protein
MTAELKQIGYFGKPHEAEVYRRAERTPTPVGSSCLYCNEPILDGDDGFIDSVDNPFHRECLFRMVIGSVAHQMGTCPCFMGADGVDDDEDGMSPRRAAKLALDYWELSPHLGPGRPG